MEALTISEVANSYKLSLRALRFYEQRGLLSPLRVGSQRYYTPKDRIRLELILKGKRLGFTLFEIERLLAEGPAAHDEKENLPLTLREITQRLQALGERRSALDKAIEELTAALGAKSD